MRFSPARINEMLFTREARLQNERRNSSLSRIGIGVEEDRGGRAGVAGGEGFRGEASTIQVDEWQLGK